MRKPIALTVVALPILLLAVLGASPAPDPAEAARLNNLGVAYMNQQLFEKALKSFNEAAANDPALEVAAVNRGRRRETHGGAILLLRQDRQKSLVYVIDIPDSAGFSQMFDEPLTQRLHV